MSKQVSLKELYESGFLFEANRTFFHRVGMALTIVFDDANEAQSLFVQDFRNDPEGIYFSHDFLISEEARDKAIKVAQAKLNEALKKSARYNAGLGLDYMTQRAVEDAFPVPTKTDARYLWEMIEHLLKANRELTQQVDELRKSKTENT